jgi:hypothetical protein
VRRGFGRRTKAKAKARKETEKAQGIPRASKKQSAAVGAFNKLPERGPGATSAGRADREQRLVLDEVLDVDVGAVLLHEHLDEREVPTPHGQEERGVS